MEKGKIIMHKFKKILLLGSGALKIGEAGEFDYSGSQAAKALKEEGIDTILINPNIATIQTSTDFVKDVYFLPVNDYFVEKVIAKERPDGILLGFGGQTALNCGMALSKKGILSKYNVAVLGTPISAIEKTEDRLLFRTAIKELGYKVPESTVCYSLSEVKKIAPSVVFPVIVRSGFSLGGLGSGLARTKDELLKLAEKSFTMVDQILIEEYLESWKELEYEVVRDRKDNTIIVCNMENFDPMGIHTGESIVVAPSQTLTNYEYHHLREIAMKVVKSLPVVGECNIQFALSPKDGDYRIIEVNARLSRSSALASKATGYPLAYVAAKLALGYTLDQVPNKVTKATTAFFEPALDYVVVKIPRWDFLKFKDMNEIIGSEMQSVGEVMAIGRSFEEALQKAIRSLDLEYEGVICDDLDKKHLKKSTTQYKNLLPTPSRLYNIGFNLFYGQSIKTIYKKTGIDLWFLQRLQVIVDEYKKLLAQSDKGLDIQSIKSAKKLGFSDVQLGEIFGVPWKTIRSFRKSHHIIPKICQIDTLAGEFPAKTNYLYFSYHRDQNDREPSKKRQIAVVGGGPYQIGSSVEFDWCAVNTVTTIRKQGISTIMINCNPETVSTDYDISDALYFEELSLERILDIYDFEKCEFIVSVGGQVPNTLAPKLEKEGVSLLGTSSSSIDKAEDREKFSGLLDTLHVKQPLWKRLTSKENALEFAEKIGYPVLIRPSYVLSGRAMMVAYSQKVLETYFHQSSAVVTSEYPVVISKFIRGAKEVDFDAVAKNGDIMTWAISEHIEHSGVHSGDASLVLPTFSLSDRAIESIKKVSESISRSLKIHGPFNIQFLVNDEGSDMVEVLVIEANLRASRSFPFVSKVMGINFIEMAARIMINKPVEKITKKRPHYFGVKVSHFSFTRLRQVDPVLRVEMASTGEVASFGKDVHEAYLTALLSTGLAYPKKQVLVSLGGVEGKQRLLPSVSLLRKMGFSIHATQNTSYFLNNNGIQTEFVYKVHDKKRPSVIDLIHSKKVGLVINLSDRSDLGVKELTAQISDGYLIRRAAVDANIPLFTKATIAAMYVEAVSKYSLDTLTIKSYDEYIRHPKRSK